MTPILIHSNHFRSSPDNLGTYNSAPITGAEPGIDWQNNEFNITPPAKLKVPVYVRPDPVQDIGDVLRFHWKDSNTGSKNIGLVYITFQFLGASFDLTTAPIPKGLKKPWKPELIVPVGVTGVLSGISIRIYNNDPAYSLKYGFHICLANLHYRNVLTDFADQSFGNWKVTQSPVNEGYDPAQYGIKQFDTYGSQPYSLWIEWPIGKKYEVGAYVEVSTEI